MVTFNVVKEKHGWSVRTGQRMSTHFRSKERAVHEARLLAAAIGSHGETTEVLVEEWPSTIAVGRTDPSVRVATASAYA